MCKTISIIWVLVFILSGFGCTPPAPAPEPTPVDVPVVEPELVDVLPEVKPARDLGGELDALNEAVTKLEDRVLALENAPPPVCPVQPAVEPKQAFQVYAFSQPNCPPCVPLERDVYPFIRKYDIQHVNTPDEPERCRKFGVMNTPQIIVCFPGKGRSGLFRRINPAGMNAAQVEAAIADEVKFLEGK